MLDLHELRPEREQLEKVSEVESRIGAAIAKQKEVVAERRAVLEAQLAEAVQALEQRKQEAEEVKGQARALEAEAGAKEGFEDAWLEVEAAEAEVKATDERLAATRELRAARAAEAQRSCEEASSLYQVYTAATGVRWFPQESGDVEGYVALAGRVHPLDGPLPFEESEPLAAAASLWEAIEACLPIDARPVVDELHADDDEASGQNPCKERAAQPSSERRVREASRGGG